MAFKARLQWRPALELGCSRWEEKVAPAHAACCVRKDQGEGWCLGEHLRLGWKLEITWSFSVACPGSLLGVGEGSAWDWHLE